MTNITDGNTTTSDCLEASLSIATIAISTTVLKICVALCGIVCNVSFWVILVRVSQMRDATFWYLLNFSIGNVFFLLLSSVEEGITQLYLGPFDYPIPYHEDLSDTIDICLFHIISHVLPLYNGIYTFLVLAILRYAAICRPFKMKALTTNSATVAFISAIWIITVISTIPDMLLGCYSHLLTRASMIFLVSLMWFHLVLALLAIVTLYAKAYKQMARHEKNRGKISNSLTNKIQRRDSRQVMKMLVLTTAIFFMSILPLYGSSLIYFVNWLGGLSPCMFNSDFYNIFESLKGALHFVDSSLTPIIYNMSNNRYRAAFKQTFKSVNQLLPSFCSQTEDYDFKSEFTRFEESWRVLNEGQYTPRISKKIENVSSKYQESSTV